MANQMINQNSYDVIISLINILNINIDDLYNYCKNQDISKQINNNVENITINKEPVKETKKCWGDYETDDESDNNDSIIKDKKISIEKKSFSEIVKNLNSSNNIDNDDNDDNGFQIVQKKNKNKNYSNTITINNLQEFLDFMRNSPKKEYKISKDAHCIHTYKGTLCPDVKKCNKVHIQRCINGNECNKHKCNYIHAFDMPNEECEDNFNKTMEKYNLIKSKKRVY